MMRPIQEDQIAEEIRMPTEIPAGSSEDDGVITLQEDQCPWCGFSDHRRKSKTNCPQHPQYSGSKYSKGAKVVATWVSCSRADHKKRARVRSKEVLTPFSVRSAPSDIEFTTKNWTTGVDELDDYTPPKFQGRRHTKPKTKHGWTIDTPPITFFNYFHPVC